MPQVRRENAVAHQKLDVSDALIAWPFELFEGQPSGPIGGIKLFRATPRVPLRLEGRQHHEQSSRS